jgi:glucokinase
MDDAGPALVIDVGGTKLAAGVAEPGGRLITWAQTPTPRDVDGEQLWRTLDALLSRVLDSDGVPVSWPAWAAGPAGRWNGRRAWSPR